MSATGLEHISTGEKVLEVREAPAAVIIMYALRHLETASLGVGSIVLNQGLEQAWSQEAVSGAWGSTIHKRVRTGHSVRARRRQRERQLHSR